MFLKQFSLFLKKTWKTFGKKLDEINFFKNVGKNIEKTISEKNWEKNFDKYLHVRNVAILTQSGKKSS